MDSCQVIPIHGEKLGKKEKTRMRILEAAGRLIREKGYVGAGMKSIMSSANLTVGGFYSHFRSKETLFAKMISDTMERTRKQTDDKLKNLKGKAWVSGFLDLYLSKAHRDSIQEGCAMPTIISELPRAGSFAQRVFELELNRSMERLGMHAAGKNQNESAETGLFILAVCLGGIGLARGVADKKISEQILQICRRHLEDYLKALEAKNKGKKHAKPNP